MVTSQYNFTGYSLYLLNIRIFRKKHDFMEVHEKCLERHTNHFQLVTGREVLKAIFNLTQYKLVISCQFSIEVAFLSKLLGQKR